MALDRREDTLARAGDPKPTSNKKGPSVWAVLLLLGRDALAPSLCQFETAIHDLRHDDGKQSFQPNRQIAGS